ncbi:MAG: hypothetical protein A2293_04260 [Elusimicrobia bacterium RIFOXYB2_FULL_49_7]|nr:MAG: hypothetical protein A2293_04260 [Elusimicrobia bacterium RIFOXYB2_FULL_49_7]
MRKTVRVIRRIPVVVLLCCVATTVIPLFSSCGHKDHQTAEEKKIVYHCPMHPNYLSSSPGKCPICGMDLVRVDNQEASPTVASDSSGTGVHINPDMVQKMGVKTQKAERRKLMKTVRVTANIVPDERRVYSVTSRVNGYIEKLHINYTGQTVKKGQPLFDVFSPDLVSAQNEYISALSRMKGPDSADPIAKSGRQRLLNLNFPESELLLLEKSRTPKRVLSILSPADGLVAEKMVVEGQAIEMGMMLYKIVDYSRIWALCDVYQQDAPFVVLHQKAALDISFLPGKPFFGEITYVAPELNAVSRTFTVRIELLNTPDLAVKPGMVATASLFISQRPEMVVVPDEAVIHSGLRTLIILSRGNGYFEPRDVTIGLSAEGLTEVLTGVKAGDDIVVSSQFLIDSESNLKAAIMKLAPPAMADSHRTAPSKESYTCPMHPEVIRDKPGSCPLCGMDLVRKK